MKNHDKSKSTSRKMEGKTTQRRSQTHRKRSQTHRNIHAKSVPSPGDTVANHWHDCRRSRLAFDFHLIFKGIQREPMGSSGNQPVWCEQKDYAGGHGTTAVYADGLQPSNFHIFKLSNFQTFKFAKFAKFDFSGTVPLAIPLGPPGHPSAPADPPDSWVTVYRG